MCASLRQRYATILSESLATFSPDIKPQAQQRLLSFLQATFTGNIRHDPKLTEALFEVALMLTGLIVRSDARCSDECRRLLAAFFEEPQRKDPASGDKPTAFPNALLLLAGFLLAFPNPKSVTSSAFKKVLFARHLFFASMATAAPGVLTRTMVAMRTQSSSNPPMRLFMTPDAFADLFTQRLRSEIPTLFKAVSEHFSNVTDQPSLYAFLTQARLVVSSFRAHCWETTADNTSSPSGKFILMRQNAFWPRFHPNRNEHLQPPPTTFCNSKSTLTPTRESETHEAM